VTEPQGVSVSGGRLVVRYVVLTVVAAAVVLPIYVTLIGALKPGRELLNFPRSLFPVDLTLDTFRTAWGDGRLGTYMLHSLVVATAITAGQMVTSVLAAYAFAFLDFPLRRVLFGVFLATLMVPIEVTVIANFQTIQSFDWVDTYRALIVPFLATGFGTFLLRQVFLTVPQDLRDAAALDGIGHWRFLMGVAVPLARPSIGAVGLFAFLGSWNQYLWPLRVTDSEKVRTVQIGLKQFATANVDELNVAMAGTILAGLPIAIVLVVFQRQLIRGLTAGAVKG
jgi:sn-glycerol 3-phosphate transport system permease protein